ncbi:MAG: hypothetical protein JWN86_435 [Planctomycetota bacterium]|nr:hypothetical protein [Planctomycetota bacterium]
MKDRSGPGIREQIESGDNRGELELLGSRLEKGHGPARLAMVSTMGASDFLAAIAVAGVGSPPSIGPTLVHSSPSRPALEWAAGETTLAEVFPHVPRTKRLALSAGLLQMLDFWDASHEAAQQADDLGEHTFSPFWHAIAHRREPDPGNAAYWFRRVGHHAVVEEIAEAVRPILDAHGDSSLSDRLLPNGAWDPFAFIAFCGEAAHHSSPETERLARRIQRAEMIMLLEATAKSMTRAPL